MFGKNFNMGNRLHIALSVAAVIVFVAACKKSEPPDGYNFAIPIKTGTTFPSFSKRRNLKEL